jgi:hypothetical protein
MLSTIRNSIPGRWFYLHNYIRPYIICNLGNYKICSVCEDDDMCDYYDIGQLTSLCKPCFKGRVSSSKDMWNKGCIDIDYNHDNNAVYYTTQHDDHSYEGVMENLRDNRKVYVKADHIASMNNLPKFSINIEHGDSRKELLYNFVKEYTVDTQSIILFLIRELSQDGGLVADINVGWYWFNALYSL